MPLKIELLPAIIFSKVSNSITDVSQESLNTKQPWKYKAYVGPYQTPMMELFLCDSKQLLAVSF